VRQADRLGLHTLLWQLADALWPLFLRVRAPEREEVQRLGLAGARAVGPAEAVGMMLTSLGGTVLSAGRPAEAVGFFQQAWQLYERLADPRGQGQASNGLGKAAFDLAEFARARTLFERALAEREAAGYARGVALTRHGLGQLAKALGEMDSAAGHFSAAYDGLLAAGDRYDAAWSAAHLAVACAHLGLHGRASELIERADGAMDQAGSSFGRGGVAELAATIAELHGEQLAARAALHRAIDYFTLCAPQRAERARERLDQLEPGHAAPDA
jgi:tetratricopeptide (TPR) repeat protein